MQNLRSTRTRRNMKRTNVVITHIQNNLREYLIVSIIFIIGILIGIVFINNLSDTGYREISGYINSFVASLKNEGNIEDINVLKNSILNNLSIGLLIWIFGSTIIRNYYCIFYHLLQRVLHGIYYFSTYCCFRYKKWTYFYLIYYVNPKFYINSLHNCTWR